MWIIKTIIFFMNDSILQPSPLKQLLAWIVHLVTASGAVFGLLAAYQIFLHDFIAAFWLMVVTIIIDAFDGFFARLLDIKQTLPMIDGALLDNIVDYFNYVILAALFMMEIPGIIPHGWHIACAVMIILSSSYQFTQKDAKTKDNFFKGFPSYWNIVVFYLFFWNVNQWLNVAVIIVLTIASFVPIKYVYPSRMDHLTNNQLIRNAMFLLTVLWGVATVGLLWDYPQMNYLYVCFSMGYVIIYFMASLYRTWKPLD